MARRPGCCHAANRKSRLATSHSRQLGDLRTAIRSVYRSGRPISCSLRRLFSKATPDRLDYGVTLIRIPVPFGRNIGVA